MRGTVMAGRWLVCFALALGLGSAGRSSAQVVIPASTVEFDDAELFKPTVDPGPFLSVYDARTLERGRFSIGSYFSYALDAMDQRRIVAGDEENETIVESLVTLNLLGALGITDRIQLGTHLPLYVTDEADRIEFAKMARIAELIHATAMRAGNLERPPARDFAGPRVGKGKTGPIR